MPPPSKKIEQAFELSPALAGDLNAVFGSDNGATVAPTDSVSVATVDSSSLVSFVFVTASPTFSGPAGGFVTLTPSNFLQPATTTTTPDPVAVTTISPTPDASTTTDSPTQTQTQTQASTQSPVTPLAHTTTATTASSASLAGPTTTSASFTSTGITEPTAASVSAAPSSISGGAIAGIVICLLVVFGAAIAGALYLYRLRRAKALDEKDPFADSAAAPMPPASHRLSIVPSHETEWMGSLLTGSNGAVNANGSNGPNGVNNAVASGALAGAAGATAGAGATRNMAAVENPSSIQNLEGANPFDNHAAVNANDSSIPAPLRINTPVGETAAVVAGGAAVGLAGGAAVGLAGAAVAGAAVAGTRRNSPTPSPNSPGPFVGAAAGAANSVRASPAGANANNVHRIQLDFKPSMDDELELRAGQLVRLLHEYDDGWALCTRLDRSRQGVAPRTCLSTRPVKPRQNPGTFPQMRLPIQGGSPKHQFPPALSPGSPRSVSSAPFRTQQPRSMSPGPYGGGPKERTGMGPVANRPRCNSDPNIDKLRSRVVALSPMNPNAPPSAPKSPVVEITSPTISAVSPESSRPQSPSLVARKPVPGQAP